jgi:hypothetical protein
MSRRNGSVLKAALGVTAFLLFAPLALAGDRYRTPAPPLATSTVTRNVTQTATVSVSVKPMTPPKAPVFVNLRGPDGTVRRFPVEGDIVVLTPGTQVSLRPGRSLTIWWVASK